MAQTFEFYFDRAREAAAEADRAVLDNVRERALRAEKTWRGLGEQARNVAEEREKVIREKAAERAAEKAELAELSVLTERLA